MARDLDRLKEVLWEEFEEAVARHPRYEDSNYTGSSTPFNPRIENRTAIANLASAIASVEREQRETAHEQRDIQREAREDNERKNGMTLPGKR